MAPARSYGKALGTSFSGLLLAIGVVDPAVAAENLGTVIETETLNVGDVFLEGSVDGDGCDFERFTLVTSLSVEQDSGSVFAAEVDDRCRLVVAVVEAIDPEEAIGEVLALEGTVLVTHAPPTNLPTEEASDLTQLEADCRNHRTSSVDFWMYGHGGTASNGKDKLTRLDLDMAFAYNCDDGQAHQLASKGLCAWKSETGWLLDDCYWAGSEWSGDEVWSTLGGDFHWEICAGGPCYFHTLLATADGGADGSRECQTTYSGTIVKGVTQRCNPSIPV